MSPPPPPPPPDDNSDNDTGAASDSVTTISPSHASFLFSSFTNFLTIAIHSILYTRKLYPPATFLSTRAYGLPVHQSRHPGLCGWIRDAVAATSSQLRSGTVRHVALVVHAPSSLAVVERWIFDVQSFPAFASAAATATTSVDSAADEQQQPQLSSETTVNANEALRGALARLAHTGQSLDALPDGECTFTLAVELRDSAEAPIRHPQVWIPSEPDNQAAGNRPPGTTTLASSTVPVRSVQAGPLFFECWVERVKTQP
ncbi:REV7-like protein [Moelleriella libera RCEF 2490]|uniref:REV7-like protein n=1 Tax=Moelleriella libera RCEF 2490 TaxID=1081109 RepID=A0A162IM41_9HYPO|nr:REV7-like protein [Moelleriella libera RCEF 2490]